MQQKNASLFDVTSSLSPWSEGTSSSERQLRRVRFLAHSTNRHKRYICSHRPGGYGTMEHPRIIIKRCLERVNCSGADTRESGAASCRTRRDIQLARMHHSSDPMMRRKHEFRGSYFHRRTRRDRLGLATDTHGHAGFAARTRVNGWERRRRRRVPPSGLGFVLLHAGVPVGLRLATDDARRDALDFGKALGPHRRGSLRGDRQLRTVRLVKALAHGAFVAPQSESKVFPPTTSARKLAREGAKHASCLWWWRIGSGCLIEEAVE